MRRIGLVLVLMFGSSGAALADMASMPVIEHETPQPVSVTSGPASVEITGHDLDADPTSNHPDYSQYEHIWIRSVSASNQAGPWTVCVTANGCFLKSGGDSSMQLQLDGARWTSQVGSHVQLHFWKGFNLTNVPEPASASGGPVSPWSRIVTWDIAAAGTIVSQSASSGSSGATSRATTSPSRVEVKRPSNLPNIVVPPPNH